MSPAESHGKKDPLVELARLLEQDEAFRAVDASANWPQRQRQEAQPLRSELKLAQSVSDGPDATAPRAQVRAPDAFMPAHASATYHEYGAQYDEIPVGIAGKHEKRGPPRVIAAVIAFAVLVASAGTFGYVAWWSRPRVSDSGSMMATEASANKGPEERTTGLRRRSESDLSTNEPTLAGNGAPTEFKTAPLRQMVPAPRALTYGLDPTVSAVPTPRDSGPPGPSADARKVKSETVPAAEGTSGPGNQLLESQPAARPNDASPAEQRATMPTGDPAPVVVGAKPPTTDPSGEAPPVAANADSVQSYIVQLSSQRSDKAAQVTAQTLQRKYQGVLGERQPFIRRSDLGTKGVYFRVLLGTFANFRDANQLCSNLKKAGGDCVVQKN